MKPAWTCHQCHATDIPHRRRDICVDCEAWNKTNNLAWCTRGRHRVEAGAMAKGKYWCRACDAARNRKYPEARRAANARRRGKRGYVPRVYDPARRRAEYEKYHERELARARRYYAANREKCRATCRAWYRANRSHARAYRRAWHERQKIKVLQSWRRQAV